MQLLLLLSGCLTRIAGGMADAAKGDTYRSPPIEIDSPAESAEKLLPAQFRVTHISYLVHLFGSDFTSCSSLYGSAFAITSAA